MKTSRPGSNKKTGKTKPLSTPKSKLTAKTAVKKKSSPKLKQLSKKKQISAEVTIPCGAIIAWFQKETVPLPEGWVICDGNNGTPNLTGRFVLAANGFGDVGKRGGTTAVSHKITAYNNSSIDLTCTTRDESYSSSVEVAKISTYPGERASRPGHQHLCSISIPSNRLNLTGTSDSQPIIPPYFSLLYIMKL